MRIGAKTMMNKLLAILLLATFNLAALAEDNPYEKNYRPQKGGLVSLNPNPDTQIFVSNHKKDDNISMLESGYDLMGESAFDGGDVPSDLALDHARAIKADTVLVYSKYGSNQSPLSQMQVIKEAAKKGKDLTEKDLDTGQTFRYAATYWAKLPAPLLGVHVIKLIPQRDTEDEKPEPIKGLEVIAVIKDSPADKAGIVRGDMLHKLDGVDLNLPESLSGMVRERQGKTVTIELDRSGENKQVTANINRR